jgi:transglutaminase/protease-like cytokinesis protein 3
MNTCHRKRCLPILILHRSTNMHSHQRSVNSDRPLSTICPFVESLINSIKNLSANRNEIDQAWIVFYWISQNIRYDIEAYFGHNINAQTSQNVFLSGRIICEGYSTLYAELCSQIGLRCRKVSGYAKGYSFDPRRTSFEKPDHAWNILTFNNGHSYVVEST